MNKDPAVLFYSNDFLTGVTDLTMEERGQYITLLCLQHQKGRLSKRTIDLNIPNISDYVMKKFILDENQLYYNERMELETLKRLKHCDKQKLNALKRWHPEWFDKNGDLLPKYLDGIYGGNAMAYTNSNAKSMPLENENENVNEDINNKLININKELNSNNKFIKPTLEEIEEYIINNNYVVSAEAFKDFYDSNGWKVSKNPMKDWKATLRGWERKAQEKFRDDIKKNKDGKEISNPFIKAAMKEGMIK